ncbi:MAG TPA: asparagine synthase (glutamine-hydrolyzing) [Gammaproteobacteria bacterium]|nr:asparagine synthase (glutamine-hydrolyzing) [Gammaproteobacteria bacterium]
MCGIAGFISFDPEALGVSRRREILELMSRAIARRGPDDAQFHDDGTLSLVFRRLSIIDVEGGQQPLWNEDHTILAAVNGEIYNHEELRAELSARHEFSTRSDCEVVLHLYEEHGESGLEKLNGMFAIVLWDTKAGKLLLARDRLGIKPLYYCKTAQGLVFASELKALLMHPACPDDLNWRDLDQVGIQQKDEVSSYVKGVHHLPAGGMLSLARGRAATLTRYWSIDRSMQGHERHGKAGEYRKKYRRLIQDAVCKQLMSDVPVGLFLSGGIDSSLIAAIAARANNQIHCFTVAERTTVSSGDLQQAISLCRRIGIPLHAAYMDTGELAHRFGLKDLERMILLMESPRFDPEWLFKYELHKFAKRQVPDIKVILIGQGADEFAGGYSKQMDNGVHDWSEYMQSIVAPSAMEFTLANHEIPERFHDYLENDHVEALARGPLGSYRTEMKLLANQLQYFNLWHEDRTSAYNGIEARVPYLDHRLVELLASVPEPLHEELFWDKNIVRDALHEQAPFYPRKREKVPFFAIKDDSSIDELIYLMAKRLYPEFREKYLHRDETIFDWQRVDELHEKTCSTSGDFLLAAWRLVEIMAITIFDDLLRNKERVLSLVEEVDETVVRPLTTEELDDIGSLKFTEPSHRVPCPWTMESSVIIPRGSRLYVALGDSAQAKTSIALFEEGVMKQELSIPHEDGWAVEMLDDLSKAGTRGITVAALCQRFNVEPARLAAILEFLRTRGFAEIA